MTNDELDIVAEALKSIGSIPIIQPTTPSNLQNLSVGHTTQPAQPLRNIQICPVGPMDDYARQIMCRMPNPAERKGLKCPKLSFYSCEDCKFTCRRIDAYKRHMSKH